MRQAPANRHLGEVVRREAKNHLGSNTTVLFLGKHSEVREILTQRDLSQGAHLAVRQRLENAGELTAIVALGYGMNTPEFSVSLVQDIRDQGMYELTTYRVSQQWVPLEDELSEQWSQLWKQGKEV